MFKAFWVCVLLMIQSTCFSFYEISDFTAVFDANSNVVKMSWKHKSSKTKTYLVQCSPDKNSWANVSIQQVSPSAGTKIYYVEDKKPRTGENYYRLISVSTDGSEDYSPTILVKAISTLNRWNIYPVPVKDLLTLEYTGTEKIKGVINIFIQQSSGRIIIKRRLSSLHKLIQIPVSNLGKGFYDIRIIVGEDIIWSHRFNK